MSCCSFGEYKCDFGIGDDIFVDKCISDEIKIIRAAGIETKASCCGHGELMPTVSIHPADVNLIESFGYKRCHLYKQIDVYYLKTNMREVME